MSKSLLHHVVDGVCHHLDLCLLLGCFSSGVLLWDSSLSRANLVVPIVPNILCKSFRSCACQVAQHKNKSTFAVIHEV